MVLFVWATGCGVFRDASATAELRVSRIGSGVTAPGVTADMNEVLETARRILGTTRFRDEVEAELALEVNLPHDWPHHIRLGVNAEQMELLVEARLGSPDSAATIANWVGRKMTEHLEQTRRYSARIIRYAR